MAENAGDARNSPKSGSSTDEAGMTYGQRVRWFRTNNCWSQYKLAKEVEHAMRITDPNATLTEQTIYNIERGIRTPRERTMIAISKVLPIDWRMYW